MDSTNSVNSTVVSATVTITSGMTVNIFILCHMYASLGQLVSEDFNHTPINPDISTNTDSDMEFIFSYVDCRFYRLLIHFGYDQCANTTDVHNYDIDQYGMQGFIGCFLFFFVKEMGAIEKCPNVSLEHTNNPRDESTTTLLSKNRILYFFMYSFMYSFRDVCEKNTTVTNVTEVQKGILTGNCWYYRLLKSMNAESICTNETDTLSNDTVASISHSSCIWYYFVTKLDAQTFCENQRSSCDMYNYAMQGMIGGSISIIGIVCNVGSLIKFFPGVVKSPTIYQLQWLAVVDTILLVLYSVHVTWLQLMSYLQVDVELHWRMIRSYINVYIWPVYCIAQTSTNALTVFSAVYRYLVICKPLSSAHSHVERHRRKYVVIVLGIAALCNIPNFFVRSLSLYEETNFYFYRVVETTFGESDLVRVVYPVFIVCLPVIILLTITLKIMVVLRREQIKNTPQNNINTVIIRILLTFTICQFPLLVDSILSIIYSDSSSSPECGSVRLYLHGLASMFTALNSASKPFIYIVLRNHFAWLLRNSSRNEKAETIEMSSM